LKKLILLIIPVSAHAQMAEVVSTVVNSDIPLWEKVLLAVIVAALGVVGFFLWRELPKLIDKHQLKQNKSLVAQMAHAEELEAEAIKLIKEVKEQLTVLATDVAINKTAIENVQATLSTDKVDVVKWQTHINNRINAAHRDICRLRALDLNSPVSDRFEAVDEYFAMKGNGSMVELIVPVIVESRENRKEWEKVKAQADHEFLTDHFRRHYELMHEKIAKCIH